MTRIEQARTQLAMHEAALAMHRDNGDAKAARSAQARINGLRTKVGKLTAEGRRHAEKLAWYGARG
jgi:hypothetical protein